MRSRALRKPAEALAFALLLSLLLGPSVSTSQETDPVVDPLSLEALRLSSPPALALIGSASSSVSRPSAPRDLIASLVSGAGSSGVVPNGYALETAPFWLVRHPVLELREYYRPSFADRIRYFTAISVATARESRSDSAHADARVAIAARTLLANGRPSARALAASRSLREAQLSYITRYRRWEAARERSAGLDQLRRRLRAEEDLLATLTTRAIVGGGSALRDSTLRTLERRDRARTAFADAESAADEAARLEKELESLATRLSSLARRLSEEDLEPDGLVIELAAGTRALFERGEWGRRRGDGLGLWITPMYRLAADRLELVGLVRYLTNVREYAGTDLLDLGLRAGRALGRASLAAEYVWRDVRGTPAGGSADERETHRWAALFNYPLSRRLQVAASFGSDYRRRDGARPVIATIGLDLGLGSVSILPARSLPD